MHSTPSDRSSEPKPRRAALVLRALPRVLGFMVLLGGTLFLCAGQLNWNMAWVYLIMLVVNSTVSVLTLDPRLMQERLEGLKEREGTPRWDVTFVLPVALLGPLATVTVAGLDSRFEWSAGNPLAVKIAASAAALAGLLIINWAIHVNRFFSAVIRIQKERGHTVVTTGPYRFVRHPGYLGVILESLAAPLMLNSLWAFIPAGFIAVVTVVRTALEDRTLRAELPGYAQYAARVRWRLVPGVW
jgi:protein-S-isoprenylcysteine O-methyltransferase Ste14